jgi:hypothetical protein
MTSLLQLFSLLLSFEGGTAHAMKGLASCCFGDILLLDLKVDCGDEKANERIVQECVRVYGRLDVFFANGMYRCSLFSVLIPQCFFSHCVAAGIVGADKSLEQLTQKEAFEAFRVNTLG